MNNRDKALKALEVARLKREEANKDLYINKMLKYFGEDCSYSFVYINHHLYISLEDIPEFILAPYYGQLFGFATYLPTGDRLEKFPIVRNWEDLGKAINWFSANNHLEEI